MLNLSLQGQGKSISHLVGHVEIFRSKVRLFTDCLPNNDLAHFSCCSDIKDKYSNADFTQFICNAVLRHAVLYIV